MICLKEPPHDKCPINVSHWDMYEKMLMTIPEVSPSLKRLCLGVRARAGWFDESQHNFASFAQSLCRPLDETIGQFGSQLQCTVTIPLCHWTRMLLRLVESETLRETYTTAHDFSWSRLWREVPERHQEQDSDGKLGYWIGHSIHGAPKELVRNICRYG